MRAKRRSMEACAGWRWAGIWAGASCEIDDQRGHRENGSEDVGEGRAEVGCDEILGSAEDSSCERRGKEVCLRLRYRHRPPSLNKVA